MPPTRAARWTTRLGRWSASIVSAASGNGQVVLGAPRCDHVGAALAQLGDHLPAEETGPSRDEDAPARPER